jgi:alpha-1,6-mannosyltransferase
MSRIPIRLVMPALIEWAGLTFLATRKPLERHVEEVIAILAVTSAVYLISCAVILNESQSEKPFQVNSLSRWVVGFAVVFRLTVAGLPPSFTDDVLRYRWEARVQLEGASPYEVAPSDAAARHLRDATYARISGPDFRAVYGPFTELVYRFAYQLIRPWAGGDPYREVFWLKLPSMVFDLGVLAALVGWKRERALLYAWSPLPVFEFWVNGHNDSLLLLPLVLSIIAAERGRWSPGLAWLGVAIAAKLLPVALLPVYAGRTLRRWKECLLAVAVSGVLLAPFGMGLIRNGPFASGFLGGWRNNDSLYGLLLWLTGDVYRAKYFAAALLVSMVAWVTWRGWRLSKAVLGVIVVLLLVSSNSHPWYLTWMLVLLPAHPSLGLLLWTALVPIAYQVLPGWEIQGEWNGVSPLRWLIYTPVFVVLLYEWFTLRQQSPKKIHSW